MVATVPVEIRIGTDPPKIKTDTIQDAGEDIFVNYQILDPTGPKTIVVSLRLGNAIPKLYPFSGVNIIPHPTVAGAYVISENLTVKLGAVQIVIDCDYYGT